MEFVTLEDVQDRILQVDHEDIDEANKFIEDTALRLGVAIDKIKSPVGYRVKRLGVVFACYNRCLASVGTDGSTVFDGSRNTDVFAQKLQFYRAELNRLEAELVVADFTGSGKAGGASIGIWRA
jgi:hypothetical protein